MYKKKQDIFGATLIILMGALFLIRGMTTSERLHADEAYFLTFARNAAVNGDWHLSGALDKPPLVIYTQALSLTAFAIESDAEGVLQLDVYRGEFAGRMVSFYSAILAGASLIALARTYRQIRPYALWAGVLFVASPFFVAWGASAFLDIPMLMWSLLAWLMMRRKKYIAGGILWGLAFASKPQALFFLPLILLAKPSHSSLGRFLVGMMPVLGLLLLWDNTRSETSIFALGAVNNIATDSLWGDWQTDISLWWRYAQWWAGVPLISVFALLLAMQRAISKYRWLWLGWIVTYSALHMLTRLNVYDRYLLLLLPVLVLLMVHLPAPPWRKAHRGALIVIILAMSISTWQSHHLPIGSDKGDNAHIDQLAETIDALPVASVVYDRWLGWEMGYYLGQWTNKRRVYFPSPDALAKGALALNERGTRYFIAPDDTPYQSYLASLRVIGFTVDTPQRMGRFLLFRLQPPIEVSMP
jgi:4-amino-4-deoxy-L-arabinose transferase-like glycosyltransferase